MDQSIILEVESKEHQNLTTQYVSEMDKNCRLEFK